MSITNYIKETRAEFKHVKWPTRKQAISYTIAVVIISLAVAYFLGGLDSLFQYGLGKLLGF